MNDEPYPRLLQEKGFGGFPSLAFMDAQGNVLASPQERSVAGFTATLGQVENYLDLKAKADGGDETVAKELFLLELQFGRLGFEEGKARYAKLTGLSDVERKQIDTQLVGMEVNDLINKVNMRQMTPDQVTAKFAEMATAGRVPEGPASSMFWQLVINHADQTKDAVLFEKALIPLKKMFGDDERNAEAFATWERRLKELTDG